MNSCSSFSFSATSIAELKVHLNNDLRQWRLKFGLGCIGALLCLTSQAQTTPSPATSGTPAAASAPAAAPASPAGADYDKSKVFRNLWLH